MTTTSLILCVAGAFYLTDLLFPDALVLQLPEVVQAFLRVPVSGDAWAPP